MSGADDLTKRYGHAVVECALKVVARTLDGNIGRADLLAYWGGAEFRIAACNCSRPELEQLCRKLKMLVACSQVHWWGDALTVGIEIEAAAAEAGDSLERVELRLTKELPDRKAADNIHVRLI